MMYIQTSKKSGNRNTHIIATIVGSFVVIVVILQFFIPHFLPALFTTIARPFWRMEFSVMSGSLDSPSSLLAQNEALKIRIQELQVANASVDSIQGTNTELLALLGRTNSIHSSSSTITASSTSLSTSTPNVPLVSLNPINNKILAAILIRPPLAPYDEFIIDVGSNQGITPGSAVYAPGNILIGTTTDVLGETSKVSLFSSPGNSYPVLIGSNHVPATAVGRGGGQYEAQIPQATQITKGDIVSDATLNDGFFGQVTSVVNNPSSPFETVLLFQV